MSAANAKLPPGNAVAYVRMSTEHQQYSTSNQMDVVREYAKRRGFEIVKIYSDEGKSGLNIQGRDSLAQMIKDVQSGGINFSAILVYDVSRWGRFQDADESAYYEYICRRAGVSVHYCAEQFENDGSPMSSVMKTMKRTMAGEYSRELSTKVSAYRLIGYEPGIDYSFIEINRKLRMEHPKIVASVTQQIGNLGAVAAWDDQTHLLHLNNELRVSIVLCRHLVTSGGSSRWIIRLDEGLKPDITVAVRMDATNEGVRDYYLLPAIDMTWENLRVAEENGVYLDAYRFETLDYFLGMAERIKLEEAA